MMRQRFSGPQRYVANKKTMLELMFFACPIMTALCLSGWNNGVNKVNHQQSLTAVSRQRVGEEISLLIAAYLTFCVLNKEFN